MAEDYAPQKGMYITYIKNDARVLDKKLEKIEDVEGIMGAFVIPENSDKDRLEIFIDHPLSEEELTIIKNAFPNGEYKTIHQVLQPVQFVGPDR